MFTRMTRLASAALVMFAFQAAAHADGPAVLSQVPDNSVGVLVVNNVDALKTQIGNYAKQMDIPLPADPLDLLTQPLGITGGLDATGSLAVVQMPLPQGAAASGDPQIPFILLLPTSDAKLLLAGMTPGDAADNIMPVTLNDTPGYAAIAGKYVAIGRNRAMLAEFLAHKGHMDKPAPEFLKAIKGNNIAIWMDVPQEAKVVGPMWNTSAQAIRLLLASRHSQAFKGPQIAIDMVDAIGDAVSANVQNAVIGLKITEEGVTLDTTGIAAPDSGLAKFVAAQAVLPPVTMAGIPSEEYTMAFAAKWDPDQAAQSVGKLMDWSLSINPMVQANPEVAPKIKEIIAQLVPLETGMRGYVNLAPGGKPGMRGVSIIDAKDPQKVMDLTIKTASAMAAKAGDIRYDAQVQPDAINVGGISFTQIITKFSLREETPDNPIPNVVKRQFEAMQRIMPPDGLVNNVGVVGNQVVTVLTSDPKDQKLIEEAIASVQAEKNNFADVQDAAAVKSILPDATALLYVRADRYMKFIMAAIGQAAPPADVPDVAPLPLIWSFKTGDQSATSRLALPKKTLFKLVEQIRAAREAAQSP